MILSQAKSTDGTLEPWANTPVGFSQNLIHARGSAVVLLAEIMELSPIEVNEKLKEAQGFNDDQIIWEKVMLAFPGWAAQYIQPYNNQVVLDALGKGQFVIVLVTNDSGIVHAVRYVGNGLCHDPLDGTEKPTITYPGVQAMVVITHVAATIPETVTEPVTPEPKPFVTNLEVLGKPVTERKPASDSTVWELDKRQKEIEKQLKIIRAATIKIKKLAVIK